MCNSCIPKRTCSKDVGVIGWHNHSDYSNLRLLDAINRVDDLAVKGSNEV